MPINLSSVLVAVPALCGAWGIGLLAHAGLGLAAEVVGRLHRRWGRRLRVEVDADTGATVTVDRRAFVVSWPLLWPTIGGVALALVWQHPILSVWTALLGVAGTVLGYRSQARKTAEDRALQELFLAALRSRYGITQSLRRTLEGVAKDLNVENSRLGQALADTIRLLQAGEPVEEAVRPLKTQGTILRRLATVLMHSDKTALEETEQLLEELEAQARAARRLAERAHVTLTVTRATLRVLMIANAAAMSLVAGLPLWRYHYRERPLTYVVATGLACAGVCYFRFKIKYLEERL